MSKPKRSTDLLVSLLIAKIEEQVGSVEHTSLTRLHVALADQIVLMLQAGAIDDDIDPVLTAMWVKLGEIWAGADGLPAPTHRLDGAYVS